MLDCASYLSLASNFLLVVSSSSPCCQWQFLFLNAISGFELLPVNPDPCNFKCNRKCNSVSMESHSVGVGFIKLLLVLVTMWQNSATVILGMEHQFLGSDNSNNSTSSPSSVLLELSYPNVKIGPYNWRYFRGKNHHSHIHLLLGFLLRSSSSFYPNASRLICNVFHWGILAVSKHMNLCVILSTLQFNPILIAPAHT